MIFSFKCCLLFIVAFIIKDAMGQYEQLIYHSKGNIPVLITAPHGGSKKPSDVSIRTGIDGNGHKIYDFTDIKDSWTLGIAKGIHQGFKSSYGGRPYIVAADFHRKYIDANRAKLQAYESPEAEKYYDFYHNTIKSYIDDIRAKFGEGVLLDIHGQAQSPGTIYRGTRNGFAVKRLVQKRGWDAITGPHGIFGLLNSQGYTISPTRIPTKSKPLSETKLSGGATLKHHGSHNMGGIDAMQFEIGNEIRFSSKLRAKYIKDMVQNIRTFMKYHYCDGDTANPPCSPPSVVIDSGYAGYSETNRWKSSSAVDNYPYAGISKSRYADDEGETTRWETTVPWSGNYHVYTWWSNTKKSGNKYQRDGSADYVISSTSRSPRTVTLIRTRGAGSGCS